MVFNRLHTIQDISIFATVQNCFLEFSKFSVFTISWELDLRVLCSPKLFRLLSMMSLIAGHLCFQNISGFLLLPLMLILPVQGVPSMQMKVVKYAVIVEGL